MNSKFADNLLSDDQQYAFNKFKRGENLFITGPGGTGKTRLIQYMVSYMKTKNINYQVCAMTGCAAVLLKCEARTLHSWSGIKLAKGSTSQIVNSVIRNKNVVKSWNSVKVLIVDEVSMMSKKIFESIELIARTIRKKPDIFGGIQIIFTGDFFQLPPVGNETEPDSAKFCFESSKWTQIFNMQNHIQLTTMFRQKDPVYIRILLQIRKGELDEESKQILQKYIKREYDLEKNNGVLPTKLFAVRSKTEFVNRSMYEKLTEDEFIFDSIEKTDCQMYLDTCKQFEPNIAEKCRALSGEELNYEMLQFKNNTNIQEQLKLKKGSRVMCTYNLDVENSICNGSQGVVVEFVNSKEPGKQAPVVLFSNGHKRIIDVQYIQSDEYPCITIGQIPLCLSWALTIHKIQGATLAMADMDLGNTIFEYGQTYVSLSRIESLEGLYLSAFHPHRIKANPLVKSFYESIPSIPENELEKIRNMCNEEHEEARTNEMGETRSIFKQFEYVEPELKQSEVVMIDPNIKRIRL